MAKKVEDIYSPPSSREEVENEMINLAINTARQKLKDGTAAASTINYYLKLGSTRERIEREMLEGQISVLEAKAEAYANSKGETEAYLKAIDAIKSYGYNKSN